jgi:hypothetical protein
MGALSVCMDERVSTRTCKRMPASRKHDDASQQCFTSVVSLQVVDTSGQPAGSREFAPCNVPMSAGSERCRDDVVEDQPAADVEAA